MTTPKQFYCMKCWHTHKASGHCMRCDCQIRTSPWEGNSPMPDDYAGSSHEEMDNYYRRMDQFGHRTTVDHSMRSPDGQCTACLAGNGPHPEDAPPLGVWQHCRKCGTNGYHSYRECPEWTDAERDHAETFRNIMPEPEGRAAQDAYERRLFGDDLSD